MRRYFQFVLCHSPKTALRFSAPCAWQIRGLQPSAFGASKAYDAWTSAHIWRRGATGVLFSFDSYNLDSGLLHGFVTPLSQKTKKRLSMMAEEDE